jgi:hypothetical protein
MKIVGFFLCVAAAVLVCYGAHAGHDAELFTAIPIGTLGVLIVRHRDGS